MSLETDSPLERQVIQFLSDAAGLLRQMLETEKMRTCIAAEELRMARAQSALKGWAKAQSIEERMRDVKERMEADAKQF